MGVWKGCLLLALVAICSETQAAPSVRTHFGSFNINGQGWDNGEAIEDVTNWVLKEDLSGLPSVVVLGFQEAGKLSYDGFPASLFHTRGYENYTPDEHTASHLKTFVVATARAKLEPPGEPKWVTDGLHAQDTEYKPDDLVQVVRRKDHTSYTEQGKGALFTRFRVDGITVLVVNVHLSSGASLSKETKRAAQMKELNKRIFELYGPQAEDEVRVWLGDFNDRPLRKGDDQKKLAKFLGANAPVNVGKIRDAAYFTPKERYVIKKWRQFMSNQIYLFEEGDHGSRREGLKALPGDLVGVSDEENDRRIYMEETLVGYPTYKRFRQNELPSSFPPRRKGFEYTSGSLPPVATMSWPRESVWPQADIIFKVGTKTIFRTADGTMFEMMDTRTSKTKWVKKKMGKTDDHWFPGYLDRVVYRLGTRVDQKSLTYESQANVLCSDHAPVSFVVDLKLNDKPNKEVRPILHRQRHTRNLHNLSSDETSSGNSGSDADDEATSSDDEATSSDDKNSTVLSSTA